MLCDDLEGWDGGGVEGRLKRKGIYVYLQLIHFILQQKLIQYFKSIILQLKKKKTGKWNKKMEGETVLT